MRNKISQLILEQLYWFDDYRDT